MKIAITGGIGSGKSYVCRMLKEKGIDIYDCDEAAKRLMNDSDDIRRKLYALIGPAAYHQEGMLNKAAVAEFLLQSETNAKAIDNIVHPVVAADFKKSGMQWMECAILFESGFNLLVDRVVVVTAPEDLRILRIMQRDGISRRRAEEWLTRQWPQDTICQRADYLIINDGRPLDPQITSIIQQTKL